MDTSFSPKTVAWLVGIGEHNSRAWFLDHKPEYEAHVKAPFQALLLKLQAVHGGTPHFFRPNRDIRFSKDKSPYKTNTSGALRNTETGGKYLEFSLNGLLAATGYYELDKEQLISYRNALTGPRAEGLGAELSGILDSIRSAGCTIGGDRLKRTPQGIPTDVPYAELLKYKSITMHATLDLEEAYDAERCFEFATRTWKAGDLLNAWMDEHVGRRVVLG